MTSAKRGEASESWRAPAGSEEVQWDENCSSTCKKQIHQKASITSNVRCMAEWASRYHLNWFGGRSPYGPQYKLKCCPQVCSRSYVLRVTVQTAQAPLLPGWTDGGNREEGWFSPHLSSYPFHLREKFFLTLQVMYGHLNHRCLKIIWDVCEVQIPRLHSKNLNQ